MGFTTDLEIEVQKMAYDMGDEFGNTSETIWTIAQRYRLPVEEVVRILGSDYDKDPAEEYDDTMDGDFDSAMTSAGWGTDEDYGGGLDRY